MTTTIKTEKRTVIKTVIVTEEVPVFVTHVLNTATDRSADVLRIADRDKIRLRDAASAIMGSMRWGSTAEGASFWNDVYYRLLMLSGRKE